VVPLSQSQVVLKRLQECMVESPSWMPQLPLAVEAAVGRNYGEV
jgi:hypothetical protein